MYCTECGASIPINAVYCNQCGTKRTKSNETRNKVIAVRVLKVQKLLLLPLYWALGSATLVFVFFWLIANQSDPGDVQTNKIFKLSIWVFTGVYLIVFLVLLYLLYINPGQKWLKENAKK
jgi:uncharacterized membrane protein YvbJ